MQSIEITGKSVDEAKKNAAAKLGVAADALSVTILEETKGLFGKSSVRIKAEVGVAAPAAKAAPRETKARASAPAKAVVEAPSKETEAIEESFNEAPPSEVEKEEKTARPRRAPRAKSESKPAEVAAEEPQEEVSDAGEAGPSATDHDADQLSGLVADMIEAADLEVSIRAATTNGRYVNIELDGRDVAHLVGKHGEVLNAMQYLVNIVAGRRFNNGIRATLDGNNYRRRREDQLAQLAIRVAEEVKKRGEEAVLDALPAFERRIVHKSLSDYQGVQTYSEGEEPNRRVVIAPA
jgi:spoIIIJ-associated protein